jgi:uncharacterized protein (DUF952 family)/lysophospholipase L1-like esterase
VAFTRYVAIGDSQTEGLNDPDGHGGFRGWADRFAELLAVDSPHLQYANLAVRGRRVDAIRAEQLAPALAMRPDIASVMGGLNDLMHPSVDLDVTVGHLDAMIAGLRDTGATVLTNTFPDPSTIAPLFRGLAPRVRGYNQRIRAAAAARGALLVDFDARGVGTDLRIWSPDRIHANPHGHGLIAAAFADTLGLPDQTHWAEPLPAAARLGLLRRTGIELRWLGRDVTPWLVRRLRGRSSGDRISAKRPRLLPVAPIFHIVAPSAWPETGEYRPASLAQEGFVHFSFADQVDGSANAFYRDEPELMVIEVDPLRLAPEIRVEDSYGGGTQFPHVYGPIPVSAPRATHPLVRTAGGDWRLSRPASAAAAASPDR